MSFFKEDTRQVPFFLLGHDLLRVLFFCFFLARIFWGAYSLGRFKENNRLEPKNGTCFFCYYQNGLNVNPIAMWQGSSLEKQEDKHFLGLRLVSRKFRNKTKCRKIPSFFFISVASFNG